MLRRSDTPFADGKPLPPRLHRDRKRYAAMAREWLAREAERLGVSESDVLAAIKRGWLPERIELIEPGSLTFDTVFGDGILPWRSRAA